MPSPDRISIRASGLLKVEFIVVQRNGKFYVELAGVEPIQITLGEIVTIEQTLTFGQFS